MYEPVIGLMSVIHYGASVPFAHGGVFYNLPTVLVAAQDAVTASLYTKLRLAAGQ